MKHYTEPVIGREFFAREDILSNLEKSAHNLKMGYRQNISIIGTSLIGKSSLLLNFLNRLSADRDILPVYVDLHSGGTKDFIANFIKSAFYNALKKRAVIIQSADIDGILAASRCAFPKSCDLAERIFALAGEGNIDDAFSEVWDIPAFLSAESGCFIVIVVDEFDRFAYFGIDRPYQILGRKIMVQQKTLFVFSSSASVSAKKILDQKLSLLFGGFKIIDIGPFNTAQSKDFILTMTKGIKIPKTLVDFIVLFTGGHPFYLSIIIDKIRFANTCGAGSITAKTLSSIISEQLFSPAGLFNQFFHETVKRAAPAESDISVMDVLRTFVKTGCFSEILNRNTVSASQLCAIVDNFMELGFMQKSGSLYAITDPMFRVWVEVKSNPRNLCFDFVPRQEWDDCPAQIENRIAVFRSEQQKSIGSRVVELLRLFDNDQFFIDERVRLLPRIEQIGLKKRQGYDMLKARTMKKACVFALFYKIIDEEAVMEIAQTLREDKTGRPKVVLIAYWGIEPAARLLAKQRLFCVWDKPDISRLFNFYKGYNYLIA
ncbi:MAG: ATP-binding protein [Candidatus Omnitrophica bacterium]|nr:ATP-binding protein [Candidatus Omnitrophota bacterium]